MNVIDRPVLEGAVQQSGGAAFEGFVRSGATIEMKAFTGVTGDAGGFAVPKEIDAEIDRVLKSISPIRGIANVVKVGSAGYRKLVTTGGTPSGWAAETDPRPGTATPTFVEIAPPMGELYANPSASQAMLDDAAFDVEAWLADEIAMEFAKAEGAAFVGGSGVSRPKGFLTQPVAATGDSARAFGTLQYLASGAAGDFAANPQERLIDLVQSLRGPYRQGASFVMNASTLARIRKFKTSDGAFVWAPSLSAGQPATLLGYPPGRQHYLSGFVLRPDQAAEWGFIEAAAEVARGRGVAETFLWALPQVVRDGFVHFETGGDEAVDAFDDVVFPLELGREAEVAPGFSTAILTSAGGREARNAAWAEARTAYDVGPGVRSEADIATLLAFFRARMFAVDWTDVTHRVALGEGTIGAVELAEGGFTAELRGVTAALDRPVVEETSPECRADLGDRRCRVAMAGRRRFARVVGVAGRVVTLDASEPGADAYGGGVLRWFGGANGGLEGAVARSDGFTVTLRTVPAFLAEAGALVEIVEGCDKSLATCSARFGNAVNFRGEPYLPGIDLLTRYPGA